METQSMDQDSSSYDTSNFTERSPQSSNTSSIPPRAHEIDRWQRHISMQDFGRNLQTAVKSIYPNRKRSRYTNVWVLILKWKTEDPDLPVTIEIEELCRVLGETYHYDIELFEIPDQKSHATVSKKINTFVDINGDSKSDLKIVYYAGHSRLSKTRDLIWSRQVLAFFRSGKYTLWQDKENPQHSTVTWTGIQHALEQAESDVLILLDSCESGVGDAGEGNGVTELMAACAFDVQANGVGHYSFTNALTIELKLLSKKKSVPVVDLYTQIYCRAQHHMVRGVKNERYPAPIHLQLTRDYQFPRSIQLSIQEPSNENGLETSEKGQNSIKSPPPNGNRKRLWDEDTEMLSSKRPCHSNEQTIPEETLTSDLDNLSDDAAVNIPPVWWSEGEPAQITEAAAPASPPCPMANEATASCDSLPEQQRKGIYMPRLLLSIRFEEDLQAKDLSTEYFAEWLRTMPAVAEQVSVEGSFRCDSTLVILALPFALWPYLSSHPAIIPLGLIKSSNMQQARPAPFFEATDSSMKPPALESGEHNKTYRRIMSVDMYDSANFSAYSQMMLFKSNQGQAELIFHPKLIEEQEFLQTLASSLHLDCTVNSLKIRRSPLSENKHEANLSDIPDIVRPNFEEKAAVPPTKVTDWAIENTPTSPKSALSMDWELDSAESSDDERMNSAASIFSRSSSLSSAPSEFRQMSFPKNPNKGKVYDKTDYGQQESTSDLSQSISNAHNLFTSASKPFKMRRGALAPAARAAMHAIRRVGACWRCKVLRKACDPGEPCSMCPTEKSKSTWSYVGCKRGSLESNAAPLQLCPNSQKLEAITSNATPRQIASHIPENKWHQQHIKEREKAIKVLATSGNYGWPPSAATKTLIRQCLSLSPYSTTPCKVPVTLGSLSGCIVQILWEISWHSWDDYIIKSEWSVDNLAVLLISAAYHQATLLSVSRALTPSNRGTYGC
ncbi:hypothetical protein LSUE1_G005163 [Lachnellula suecica]|uniref:Uncharacterized protein n=1 Tax=Lachnellula suecica TaxID=602035 RepID=A0A8T9C9R3_9HELO|nr:hypothetical protein LSUE1_G005163 [Lachnellula suecica]